jgi:oligoribonuclease NrnB/cAMP/cGMP phosphodiesterase (DHH superfamily)
MSRFTVLYHRGCNDGLAAAWAAREVLKDQAIYLPYQYGDEIPVVCLGTHLILVDLSLTQDQISEIYDQVVMSIMVVDHHASAERELMGLVTMPTFDAYRAAINSPTGYKVFKLFDQEHSGAVLSWAFFNNVNTLRSYNEEWVHRIPKALLYIEDYDLWRHVYPESKAVNAWLINGGASMDRVSDMIDYKGDIHEKVLELGNAMIKYDEKIARSVIRDYAEEYTYGDGTMVVINAPHHLRNMIGDLLSSKYLFVVCYTRRKDRTIFSLRSQHFDVSPIAEQHGGGGHRNAAAFSVPNAPNYNLLALMSKPSFMSRLRMALTVLFPRRSK